MVCRPLNLVQQKGSPDCHQQTLLGQSLFLHVKKASFPLPVLLGPILIMPLPPLLQRLQVLPLTSASHIYGYMLLFILSYHNLCMPWAPACVQAPAATSGTSCLLRAPRLPLFPGVFPAIASFEFPFTSLHFGHASLSVVLCEMGGFA